jgi:integrase
MSQIRNSGKRRVERAPLGLSDPRSAWHYLLTAGFSIRDDESILTINKGLKCAGSAGIFRRSPAAHVSDRGREYTDLFTLQYVAGHDNIKTTMRYVHPREEAVEKLFVRLRQSGAAGGACRMQKVGAKSGAVRDALRQQSG